MIRRCASSDDGEIFDIVNDAALAYRGVIPADCWHEPYMPREELVHEMRSGVEFWGFETDGVVRGVMGLQRVRDVFLIRHAYVRSACRRQGIGCALLDHLLRIADLPVLVGTWAAATWAIEFYRGHGFVLVTPAEKDTLLRAYWSITERQVATSVVLADPSWIATRRSPVLQATVSTGTTGAA